jgi:hypothetical protein
VRPYPTTLNDGLTELGESARARHRRNVRFLYTFRAHASGLGLSFRRPIGARERRARLREPCPVARFRVALAPVAQPVLWRTTSVSTKPIGLRNAFARLGDSVDQTKLRIVRPLGQPDRRFGVEAHRHRIGESAAEETVPALDGAWFNSCDAPPVQRSRMTPSCEKQVPGPERERAMVRGNRAQQGVGRVGLLDEVATDWLNAVFGFGCAEADRRPGRGGDVARGHRANARRTLRAHRRRRRSTCRWRSSRTGSALATPTTRSGSSALPATSPS